MAGTMTSTGSSAGRTRPAESRPSDLGRRLGCVGCAFGAVATWIGWMLLSPALGFPSVSPPGMINQTLGVNPRSTLGWAALFGGHVALATAYLVAVFRGLLRPGLSSGTLFGLAVWFVTGAVLMPLMGILSAERPSVASMYVPDALSRASMRETFMMLHLGIRAPIGSLIAWLLFGAVLGTTASALVRRRKLAG